LDSTARIYQQLNTFHSEIEQKAQTMAELTIRPEEIRDALNRFVRGYEPETASREEVGTVVTSGDGIARVEGLPSAMANELLEFENGTLGIALNLDVREIGVVVMGESGGIEEGQVVKRTGDILSVPVGDGYLGRTVDALANPIDGLGEITNIGERRPLELQAAGVMDRQGVNQPLQTGIKAIDAMIPIGRGQRQLIIGDRKTGKTAIAVDTIMNQKSAWESGDPEQQVRCIYVAIGQKGSTIAAVRGALEEAGALEYTTIVAAPASDPAGYKYVAPYTGSAIGQHWMYQGKHVLIIFDDLTKQAEAYRAMSLLLRRPPGREAYPGDVFYLHSRLLERCAKLSNELGGGSMTGLPIIETKANDVSAYIPTNVISITDGQIFLQSDLFNANQRPAIDVGISVSRVGGAAQIKAMKNVAGSLKLELAQFRDMQAFAMFASDLDATTRRQLDRGGRLVELLRQPQYSPYPVEEQVVSVWAGIQGLMDEVPVDDILRFEQELLEYLRHHGSALRNIRETKDFDDDTAAALREQIAEFKKGFQTSEGKLLAGREEHVALEEEEVTQERIVRQKRG
jgi:F-type H+-transporting ATPase subunit alpha